MYLIQRDIHKLVVRTARTLGYRIDGTDRGISILRRPDGSEVSLVALSTDLKDYPIALGRDLKTRYGIDFTKLEVE